MGNEIAPAVKTYNRAKNVSVLWVLAVMLPVFMIPQSKWHFELINFGALAVFVFVVFFLVRFIRGRVAQASWAISDSVVYILVPLALFFGYLYLMLSPAVR